MRRVPCRGRAGTRAPRAAARARARERPSAPPSGNDSTIRRGIEEPPMDRRLASFEEFWPFYVAQHLNPVNRALHFVGTTLVLACAVAGVLVSPLYFAAMPFAGYGFAWVGHFAFEKNKPATFTYPLWSLRGDFSMYRLMWLGRMDREV